ncbi:MAG: permease-like cell division protein FtsX [Bacteroidales bacterium]|nr:permease-like cell division protein FtsX [Bacteroidales bacterium]MBP5676828.1 permease-like cell division protein FtsX [Bacteroidales bacterium]
MPSVNNSVTKRRLASSWLSTVISLSLVLLLVGIGSMLLVNAKAVSDYFKENLQVEVLMKDYVDEEEAEAYQKKIASVPGVRGTRLVSRDEGMEEMSQMLGRDFLDVFETAPVPVSVEVNLEAAYVSADSLAVIQDLLADSPLVDEVVYQTSLVDALNQNLGKITLGLAVLVAVLLFISFVLMANTVRLDLFSRRFSIHTMQLVGATRRFIRAPFVGRAAFQGLIAALLAILILLGGLFFLKGEFSQLFSIFTLESLLEVMGIMLVSGVFICCISTYFMVNRLVAYNRDLIYTY